MLRLVGLIIISFIGFSVILTLAMCKAASKSRRCREFEEERLYNLDKTPTLSHKYTTAKNNLTITEL